MKPAEHGKHEPGVTKKPGLQESAAIIAAVIVDTVLEPAMATPGAANAAMRVAPEIESAEPASGLTVKSTTTEPAAML